MSRGYNIAVVGATGAVGREMLKILEERNFPIRNLRAIASERSEGKTLKFAQEKIKVENLGSSSSFKGIEIALFSAGAPISKEFSPKMVKAGAVVVDNSKAFRMEEEVPLIVPEVNPQSVRNHKGIIANPNCSTIQLVVAINPIHKSAHINRLNVSTYQAVSGTGKEAIEELKRQVEQCIKGEKITRQVYPHQIAFNLLPHIGDFLSNGYTEEEMKLVNETRKIMEDESITITATCVRVPVFISHSEAVNLQTERKITPLQVKNILLNAPGVILEDKSEENIYPLPLKTAGRDEVFVGRIREDFSTNKGINLWIVADNLRKGAALNTIQIAELLIKENLI
ncbi:MAG: aspartate-semialdehyde dehydrogenase [Candidatus Aerophobetes bacterium]|nr:aspartate-semialdehyde dehydrogenase [Candidatus Aerophobetes bacterium]